METKEQMILAVKDLQERVLKLEEETKDQAAQINTLQEWTEKKRGDDWWSKE